MLNGEPRWLDGIRGENSRRLIESPSRIIKVLAGPGAGKTTCLTRRVMRLADIGDVHDPREIFVGTFTRVIAKALNDAFATNRDDPARQPVVRTLHAHAASILRENPGAVQGRRFRFLLQHEETVLLYDIAPLVPNFGTQAERRKELKKLQAQWATRRNLDDARFEGAVDGWLRLHGGMLVGEVVFIATNAIMARNLRPARFRHVFVDEYQDLTECEQFFVDLITREDGAIVVLGDNDQSIYGFRFNHPDGIMAFPPDAARRAIVDDISLPDNFRCARSIVELANDVAARAGSVKPPMIAATADEGTVTYVDWLSVDAEVEGIAQAVRARKDTRFLILVAKQFMGYRLKALIGDDAVTTFREEVLETHFVRERFALATLLADEADFVSLRAWFALRAELPRQADHRNVEAYDSLVKQGELRPGIMERIAEGAATPHGSGRDNIRRRAESFLEAKRQLPLGDLEPLLNRLFDPALATTMPRRPIPKNESAEDREKRDRLDREDRDKAEGDLDLLRRASLQLARTIEDPTFAKVMEQLRYRIGTLAPLLDDEGVPRVRIMTLHGAKGLEENSVIISGLADEIIPGPERQDRAEQLAHVSEQRRLLYVGVTRAKRELVLSWARSIAISDTYSNMVIAKQVVRRVGSIPYTLLTRTSLLPPQTNRPVPGTTWVRQHAAP